MKSPEIRRMGQVCLYQIAVGDRRGDADTLLNLSSDALPVTDACETEPDHSGM